MLFDCFSSIIVDAAEYIFLSVGVPRWKTQSNPETCMTFRRDHHPAASYSKLFCLVFASDYRLYAFLFSRKKLIFEIILSIFLRNRSRRCVT